MHAFRPSVVLRDVQEREGSAIRGHGHPRGSQSQRGVYQDGRPLRARAWRHEQQQLRQRGAHRRHSRQVPGSGEDQLS